MDLCSVRFMYTDWFARSNNNNMQAGQFETWNATGENKAVRQQNKPVAPLSFPACAVTLLQIVTRLYVVSSPEEPSKLLSCFILLLTYSTRVPNLETVMLRRRGHRGSVMLHNNRSSGEKCS